MSLVESADLIERVKATLWAQSEGAACDMRTIKENIVGENPIYGIRSTTLALADRIRGTLRNRDLRFKLNRLVKNIPI